MDHYFHYFFTKREESRETSDVSDGVDNKVSKRRWLSAKYVNLLEDIGLVILTAAASAVIFGEGYIVGANSGKTPPCRANYSRKVYPPLSSREMTEFVWMRNRPDLVQNWIDNKANYMHDEEQFNGNLCNPEDSCDVNAPAAWFLRSKLEDCDGVLMFAHYALSGKGYGLILHGDKGNHALYAYMQDGRYGIISINQSEYREPIYTTIDELAHSIAEGRNYRDYHVLFLPHDEETLLYDFNANFSNILKFNLVNIKLNNY